MTSPLPNLAVGDTLTAAFLDEVAGWTEAWTAYTPALTAATTNPNLGTGGTRVGRYMQIGKTVIGQVAIAFGSSGTSAGNGSYFVGLPLAALTPLSSAFIGGGMIEANGLWTPVHLLLGSATTVTLRYSSAAVNGSLVVASNTAPGAWTAGDGIRINFAYEAA